MRPAIDTHGGLAPGAHPQGSSSDDPKPKRSLAKRLIGALFGYDFFIAYAWKDARPFAQQLCRGLEQKRFEVFLDSEDYVTGDDWKGIGAWALARTSYLVVVASPAAAQSEAVAREVRLFRRTGRRIFAIEFDEAGSGGGEAHRVGALLLGPTTLTLREEPQTLGSGSPRPGLVAELGGQFERARQETKRLRWLAGAVVLFIALALGAISFAVRENIERARVHRLGDIADLRQAAATALSHADRQPEAAVQESVAAWNRFTQAARASLPGSSEPELANARADILSALLASLVRHSGWRSSLPKRDAAIEHLAYAADADLLAVATGSSIELWSVKRRALRRRIPISDGESVDCMDMNRDGSALLAGGGHELRFWQLPADSGDAPIEPIHSYRLDPSSGCGVGRLEPGTQRAILGLTNGDLSRLDLGSGRFDVLARRTNGRVRDIVVDRLGRRAFVAWEVHGEDDRLDQTELSEWDLTAEAAVEQPFTVAGTINAGPRSLLLTEDEQKLLSGHGDGTFAVWDVSTRALIGAAGGLEDYIGFRLLDSDPRTAIVAMRQVGQSIAALNDAGSVTVWDLGPGNAPPTAARTFKVENRAGSTLAGLGGQLLATGGQDGYVRIWDADGKSPIERVLAPYVQASIAEAIVFPTPDLVVGAGRFGDISWRRKADAFDASPGSIPRAFEEAPFLALSPSRTIIALGALAPDDRVVRLAALGEKGAEALSPPLGAAPKRATFSPGGRYLAVASEAAKDLWLFDLSHQGAVGRALDSAGILAAPVEALAFSADDRALVAIDGSGEMAVWDLPEGVGHLRQRDPRLGTAQALSLSRDGQLALGYADGTITVGPLAGTAPPRVLNKTRSGISILRFDPEGRWLISTGEDDSLLIWDIATWRVLVELPGLGGNLFVRHLAISPDGRSLAVLKANRHFLGWGLGGFGNGGSLSVWSLDPEEWVRAATALSPP
ncbi:MAG TPA: toll/interleukin-1 receptor domain-containing protein [Thermoanaerobaculia bacterium]|nr:toll/interleukin-1 receptor domain-containing protein [Thermoanaerobaculia bacterium]